MMGMYQLRRLSYLLIPNLLFIGEWKLGVTFQLKHSFFTSLLISYANCPRNRTVIIRILCSVFILRKNLSVRESSLGNKFNFSFKFAGMRVFLESKIIFFNSPTKVTFYPLFIRLIFSLKLLDLCRTCMQNIHTK